MIKIRRALLSVSNKSQLESLGKSLSQAGAELVATGKTKQILEAAGLKVRAIESLTGMPEAFQGRMKTLSFHVCSGILYRRGDAQDERDLQTLKIEPIDCVVVNFYPFEEKVKNFQGTEDELIEEIDIGGPTLVRAAAKNSKHVLVLTSPEQYSSVIEELDSKGGISEDLSRRCASQAWTRVREYDGAIADRFGSEQGAPLRYGENPHQKATLQVAANSPIAWNDPLTSEKLSYNNILDLSSAYELLVELKAHYKNSTVAVIVKHNNPCGVAVIPVESGGLERAQRIAIERAWEGDPVSSFGGVIALSDEIQMDTAQFLRDRFVELVAAPALTSNHACLKNITEKRKKLKAVRFDRIERAQGSTEVSIAGGRLLQDRDQGLEQEKMNGVTLATFPKNLQALVPGGIATARALKSNTIVLAREIPKIPGSFQLVGAGQGQPNRVEALERLAVPRAEKVFKESGGEMSDCILVSDAFFPFRDTVDVANAAGIKFIVQPGGSLKDQESIDACNEHRMAMIFTGVRHFRH